MIHPQHKNYVSIDTQEIEFVLDDNYNYIGFTRLCFGKDERTPKVSLSQEQRKLVHELSLQYYSHDRKYSRYAFWFNVNGEFNMVHSSLLLGTLCYSIKESDPDKIKQEVKKLIDTTCI